QALAHSQWRLRGRAARAATFRSPLPHLRKVRTAMTRTLTVGPRFLPADRSESPSLRYIDVSWPSTALSVMLSLPAMTALERPSAIHWRSSRCMGLIKTTGLVGSTLAAYNLDRIRSFQAPSATGPPPGPLAPLGGEPRAGSLPAPPSGASGTVRGSLSVRI